MRFIIPTGNPTAVFDRAEGRSYHLTDDKETLLLWELLNTMHQEIIRLDKEMNPSCGQDFSGGKIQPAAPCINTECINYQQDYKTNCQVKSPLEECDDYVPRPIL